MWMMFWEILRRWEVVSEDGLAMVIYIYFLSVCLSESRERSIQDTSTYTLHTTLKGTELSGSGATAALSVV